MTLRSPYLIDGPAVISFSGGRTSGFMLWHILEAHGGALPDDVRVVFCNTGKEMPETLDFVRDCGAQWNVNITWLEYRFDGARDKARHHYEVVSHNSASRDGEPFEQLIKARSFLPNPVTRFCSIQMKIQTAYRWVRADLGWDHWTSVIGLRADEPRRVAKSKARSDLGKDRFETICPLSPAGVTKAHVKAFWDAQPFDLRLPNVRGSTPLGNCDLCFMKAWPTIHGIMRDRPELADWWIAQEADAPGLGKLDKPEMALFRSDRPSYAETLALTRTQGDMLADDESALDCACTD